MAFQEQAKVATNLLPSYVMSCQLDKHDKSWHMPLYRLQSSTKNKHEKVRLTSFQHQDFHPKQSHAPLSLCLCATHPDLVQRSSPFKIEQIVLDPIPSHCAILHLNHPFNIQWIIQSTHPDSIIEISFEFWTKYTATNSSFLLSASTTWLCFPC